MIVCESRSSQRSILENSKGCEDYGGMRKKSALRHKPWFEDLVRRPVRVLLGEILSRILLGEGSFEAFERIRVEKVVWVEGFAWWVMWHWPGRGGRG